MIYNNIVILLIHNYNGFAIMKEIYWIGDTRDILVDFPEEVSEEMEFSPVWI